MIKLSIGSEISHISSWTVAETPVNYQSNRTTRIINSGVSRLRNISQWGLLCDINFLLTNTDLSSKAFMRYLIPTYQSHVWVGVRLKISKLSISIKPHDWTSSFHSNWRVWCGCEYPDNNVHTASIGPNSVLSAPDWPHVGPMNIAIKIQIKLHPLKHESLHVLW